MAPLLLMLSSSVLTTCLPDFLGYTSATNDSPHKDLCLFATTVYCSVSQKIVSVATGSCLLGTFNGGFPMFQCLFIGKDSKDAPHCVVWSIACLTLSELTQPKYGLNLS